METTTNLTDETLSGLQDLIQINIDSAEGFRTAADNVPNPTVSTLFRELAAERASFANDLKSYVRINREEPEQDGSWKGKIHRWWIGMRSNLTADELKAVLREAERGEDKIKAVYEETMKDIAGNPVSDVLHRQYARVKVVHDRVRDARDTIS